MFTYIHVHIHTYSHTYICIYIYSYTYIRTCSWFYGTWRGALPHQKKRLSRHEDDDTCEIYNADCESIIQVTMLNSAPSIMKEYPHLSPFQDPHIVHGAIQTTRRNGGAKISIWKMAKEKVESLAQTAGMCAFVIHIHMHAFSLIHYT